MTAKIRFKKSGVILFHPRSGVKENLLLASHWRIAQALTYRTGGQSPGDSLALLSGRARE
jgi:hypothetical protein